MNLLKWIIGLLLLPVISYSQIPNPSFENWTNSIPDGWLINSSPPTLLPVLSSNDAHTGLHSLKCQVVDDSGLPFGPFVQSAAVTSGLGFPYSQQDSFLYGYYKSGLFGTNLGLIEVWVYDSLHNQIGVGISFLTAALNYTKFSVPIIYLPGTTASEMAIIIQMTDTSLTGQFNIGSHFLLDDLTFDSSTVGISDPPSKSAFSVYPNPATDHIYVESLFNSDKKILASIYNAAGKKIDCPVAHRSGEENFIDVSSLIPGTYLLVLTDGEHSKTEKIQIVR